jgi:hypothetical protein
MTIPTRNSRRTARSHSNPRFRAEFAFEMSRGARSIFDGDGAATFTTHLGSALSKLLGAAGTTVAPATGAVDIEVPYKVQTSSTRELETLVFDFAVRGSRKRDVSACERSWVDLHRTLISFMRWRIARPFPRDVPAHFPMVASAWVEMTRYLGPHLEFLTFDIVTPARRERLPMDAASNSRLAENLEAWLRHNVVSAKRDTEQAEAAVRAALADGAVATARATANAAAQDHPESESLRRLAEALSPPRLLAVRASEDRSLTADRDWLREHANEYSGQWLAVRDGKLAGRAPTLRELRERVGQDKGILFTKAI